MAHTSVASLPNFSDYSRLENTVFAGYEVRHLSVAVIGAGALGNEVLKALGLLGVRKVLVVDRDIVESSNCSRSVFFRSREVYGRNKALALAESAKPLFPDTEIMGVAGEVADIGFGYFAASDILFSCVDNDLARLEIAYISNKLRLPVVDAGLGTDNYSQGRVSYFPGKEGACYGCLLTPKRRRELLSLWASPVRSCWFGGPGDRDEVYPSTPTMAAIVGSMQVELGLRAFFGSRRGGPMQGDSVEVSLAPTPRLGAVRLSRSGACPLHSRGGFFYAASPSAGVTVGEFLASVAGDQRPDPVLVLDWPVCVGARCCACGYSWSPMQRLAAFRKWGSCPGCGSRRVVEKETIQEIGYKSCWVGLSPAELGLPENHLHTVRLRVGE